jgi:ABC-type nitrate/sulfonate/bicarbonate transport system permease component
VSTALPRTRAAEARRRDRRERLRYYAISASSVVAVLLLWYFVIANVVDPLYFPTPQETIQSIRTVGTGLFVDAGATAWRVIAGLVLGAAIGTGTAIVMSASRTVAAITEPFIETLRPVPALALIPFFVLWFGLGDFGKILLIALGGFVVMVVTVYDALRHVSPIYVNSARSLGASDLTIYRTVRLPAILPAFWSGLRVSAALSFGIGIAAEFIGAQNGLGYLILLARRTLDTPVMLVGVILIGILSYLTDRLIRYLAARTTRWASTSS